MMAHTTRAVQLLTQAIAEVDEGRERVGSLMHVTTNRQRTSA
jgi:hypothetical protein